MSNHSKYFKVTFDTKTIVILGLMTALQIVLSRFLSFSVWNMKIGFGFAPIVIAAMLLGPIPAAIVGGLSDFLGAILFPIGTYFPGFTLTATLTGLVFGLLLWERQSLVRIVTAVGITQLILSLLVNTYWISLLYGTPYVTLFPVRLIQTGILVALEILVIVALSKAVRQLSAGRALA